MTVVYIVDGRVIEVSTPALMLGIRPTLLDNIVTLVMERDACRDPRSVKARVATLHGSDIGIRYGNFFAVRITPSIMFLNLGRISYSGGTKYVERMFRLLFGEKIVDIADLMLACEALYAVNVLDDTINEAFRRAARRLVEVIASNLQDASRFYMLHAIYANSLSRLILHSNTVALPEVEPSLICRASKVVAFAVKLNAEDGGRPGSIVETNPYAIRFGGVYISTFSRLNVNLKAYIYTRDKGEVYGIVANPDVDVNVVRKCIDDGRVVCV